MPVGNRIALFGFGSIGRSVRSAILNSSVKSQNNFDFGQLTKVIFDDKCVSLTDIYKKIQHKYYPETDYFNKFQKK